MLLKKKNTIVIPIIMLLLNVAAIIFVAVFFSNDANQISNMKNAFYVFIHMLLFVQILFAIVFASIKAINLFSDLQREGIEIIVFSKQTNRKTIILGKNIFFILITLTFSLLILFSNLIIFLIIPQYFVFINHFLLYSFFSSWASSLFFGLISSLIVYRFSSKIALTITSIVFAPLVLVGSFLNVTATSTLNSSAYFLNLKNDNTDSKTIVNAEQFFLNDSKDKFFVIPKNVDNNIFSDNQNKYLELTFNDSANSAQAYQSLSWLLLPYQNLSVFDHKDDNFLNYLIKNDSNNLSNYLYYKNSDSKNNTYLAKKYDATNEEDVKNAQILALDLDQNNIIGKKFIVPGFLKVASQFNNLPNREIIYARENADNFNVRFDEDQYTTSTPDNLVGSLKSQVLLSALKSPIFNQVAQEFFDKLFSNIKQQKNENNSVDVRQTILDAISEFVNDEQDQSINKIIDNSTPLFAKDLDIKTIKNFTEKKVYLATALLYYMYFSYQGSEELQQFFATSNADGTTSYALRQIEITINKNKYFIGGYASYIPVQQLIDRQIVYRFELNKSNNFVFQPTNEIVAFEFEDQVVNKSMFPMIWFSLIIILLVANYFIYLRKDYK